MDVLAIAPRYQRKNAAAGSWCNSYTEVPVSGWTALAGLFRHVFSGAVLAPWFFTRTSPRAVAALKLAIEQHHPTELWIDFPSSLGFARHAEKLPVHYFVHDVVSQKVVRSPLKRLLFPWVQKVEASLLSKVTHCYLLSEKDEQLLRHLQFDGRAEVWGVLGRSMMLAPSPVFWLNSDPGRIWSFLATWGVLKTVAQLPISPCSSGAEFVGYFLMRNYG
ncbi:DUF4403 family protein [Metapseudomonas otitidis]|uniref:DUF4403 family protein n=1 Tax=Metapseudomonas otitidis TaxID=319939 RepID=UPI001F1F0201|nr:DUF4403 family protein [Pseudomonas otitidis]